jgi:hypothetical protein
MAAGGAGAFAAKKKRNQNLASQLKRFPKEAFLTDDEAKSALEMLKNGK